MTSNINPTLPAQGTATTSSVRTNFLEAAKDIDKLLRSSFDFQTSNGSSSSYTASFPNGESAFTLVDGARVLIKIHTNSTGTVPTLNVNTTANKTIVTNSGGALQPGDLAANGIYDFVYSSVIDKWVCLNLASFDGSVYAPAGGSNVPFEVAGPGSQNETNAIRRDTYATSNGQYGGTLKARLDGSTLYLRADGQNA